MRQQPVKLNHRRPRSRSLSNGYQDNKNSKTIRPKCSVTVKVIKLISAILVPLMIGIFTIITTIQESKNVQLQKEAEIRQRDVDALKIKEQQQRDDIHAKEIRIQNIYDTFMRDISSIVLKDKSNLTMSELMYARSKTLLTLEQVDAKRKSYLIQFLYDSQMLYTSKLSTKYIDLAGVDLSNIKFGFTRQFSRRLDLRGIRLSSLLLNNSTFDNVALHDARFDFSDLNNSNFISVSMVGATFQDTILENSKFILSHMGNSSFKNAELKQSSWSAPSIIDWKALNTIDFSNSDMSESTFQYLTLTTSVKFDNANCERINFIDIKFSTGTILNKLNMKMAKFSRVQLINGKFIECDLFGAIFEQYDFKNVIFENVDLRQSQFNNFLAAGSIRFNRVNLNGSNLNISNDKVFQISNSFLPNGKFKTSSVPLEVNLIRNSNAEQGQCYHLYPTLLNITPQNWTRQGDVVQMSYTSNNLQMNITNYTNDWNSCFFFGGYQSLNQSNSNENILQQEINVEQLSILINSRQAKYNATAYLGGFADEQSSTLLRIGFKNTKNRVNAVVLGPVTHVHRQNQTTMLFCSSSGTIPNDTISIIFEIVFHRQKSQSGFRFGIADNLNFFIQQK